MSGFEVAGIVLAAFPLCIELVKLYQTSTSAVTAIDQMRMRHHKRALQIFERELGMEHTKLVNSVYELFSDKITRQDYDRLFRRDPTYQGAQVDCSLRSQLESMFHRPGAANSFVDAFEDLMIELKELEKSLQGLHLGIGTDNMTTVEAIQAGCKNPEVRA